MKIVKVFMLVIFFSILIFISLSAFATNSSEKQASDFQSNGDLIEGWYWLRDSTLHNYAEWTFNNIPLGPEEITVQINALATDRPSGGRGFDAKFLLYYSFRGEGLIPTMLIPPQTVTLDNISSPDDPLGYSCQGQITIPASTLPAASRISLRIRRDSAQDNHVAFKKDSVVLLTDAIYPPNVDPSSNDDDFEGAVPVQQGTYTGSLGEEDEEGHRDNRDYYSINIEEGQQITLQLTVPGNANYGISLFNPNKSPRGSSITQRELKTLDYVADSTGTWYIKIHRSSGEGEYQLAIDIQDQNDAESGQDAEDSYQGAIPVSPDTFTGLLKAGDNRDYYSINIEEGQLITLQLTVPGNANYGISLLNPNRSSRGSSITQRDIKILDYVADSTGTWYIKIHRSSGEGEYQLAIDIQNQNDAESGQDASDFGQGAMAISPGTITGLLKAGDNRDYYSINIEEGQQITLQLTVPGNANYGISLLNPNKSPRGSSITQRELKTLDYVADSTGTWYIKIHRSSGEGEYQLAVNSSGVPGNHSPVISSLAANQDSIEINHDVDITCDASDQDGDTLRFGWTVNGVDVGGNNSSLNWRAPATVGTYTITCTVNDSKGGQDRESVSITITEAINHSPVISSLAANQDSIEINHDVDITCDASDQDGDTLTFNWTANGVDVGGNNSSLNWRAPATAGTYTITCTVSDGKGGEDSESVSITVTDDSGGASLSCSYSFSSCDSHFSSSGGSEEFTVTPSNSDCQWIAVSDVSWIQIDSGGTGPGSQTLRFSVQNNNSGEVRTGQIIIEENRIHTITQEPKLNLTLSNQGRTLTSNLPIFIKEDEVGNLEIDSDGDGIRQEWEGMAMERINPYIELDEEEHWLVNQNIVNSIQSLMGTEISSFAGKVPQQIINSLTDHVANFVRIHPYMPGIGETGYHANHLPKYIIFRYVVTWSEDYGRQTVAGINIDFLTSHDGDHERIFMAWKVVNNYTLHLEWVFTSSHKDPDKHHAVWNTAHRTCNKGDVAGLTIDWSSISEYDHSEIFCGDLQFSSDGRLIVFASEGKHALYPSCDVCEDVMLVDLPGPANIGEDCGGGGQYLFECYNIGEPGDWKYKDGDIHDLTVKYDDNYEKFGGNLPEELDGKLKARYQIMVITGHDKDAGTDARLTTTLFGEGGSNSFFIYTNEEPPRSAVHVGTFEKNDIDNIYIQSGNLGTLNQIKIVSNNSGSGPGWFVYLIQVQDLETGAYWVCEPNAWIAETQGLSQTFNFE